MFSPASLKGASPTPVDEGLRSKFFPIYIIIIFLSIIPLIIWEYNYIFFLWCEEYYWLFFFLLPINMCIAVYILQFSSVLVSSLILLICKLLYYPKEGIFLRDIRDKNYYFFCLRNIVKKWALYLIATNPLPWLKTRFTLRFFGVKIGKNTICDNAWISSEFIEIGKNVIIGMGTTIISFGLQSDKFILKKVCIEDNVLIGAKCVLMPGTKIKRGITLSAHSTTKFNQMLNNEGALYLGNPAKINEM